MNLRILYPLLVLISSGAPTFLVGGGGGAGLAHTFFCLICFFAAVLTINDSVGAHAYTPESTQPAAARHP